jgi:hypothetical protein
MTIGRPNMISSFDDYVCMQFVLFLCKAYIYIYMSSQLLSETGHRVYIVSCMSVTMDGVLIGNWIY